MKKIALFSLSLVCIGFNSCKKSNDVATDKVEIEKPISSKCYQARYENDTINLEINTLKNQKITGNMEMIFFDLPKKNGEIKGEFRGDTLFVDYTFTQGTNNKVVFKNPIALLKKDSLLILGNGKIETYLGSSYFVKGKPIDFHNVKFKFNSVDCIIKK